MVENKRRKFHDKDKYYRLAKEQGLRSRAAFKLTQINRKFPILSNAKVVLDLCAAPGGWTQIASRTLPKQGSLVIAVDILPIRSLGPNVITMIGDITTDSCKAAIKSQLQGSLVDVVLHDGAPNVGASYDKDAYEQNEIALHALKCATQHLKPNGSFCTKLYRSRDYASYVWVAKQFFREVQAVKPSASRAQSAEIFLVCQQYIAPTKIDPRMLDPKCIFEQVEGDSTGGGNQVSKLNVFHKSWDVQKRHRSGYDMEHLDASMRHIQTVDEFIQGKDPISLMSTCTGFQFQCPECDGTAAALDEDNRKSCDCLFYLRHPATTVEIKACVSDLKVLNKSDFKGLLTWRTKLQDAWKKRREAEKGSDDDNDDDDDSVDSTTPKVRGQVDPEKEEDEIQAEIASMRQRRFKEKKKGKKKERALAAKRRRRAALGMDLNAIDVPEHDQIFSLATITSKGDLEAAREVDLDKITDDQLLGDDDDEDDDSADEVSSQGDEDQLNEDTGYSYRLDRELDDAYDRYLHSTKDGMAKSGTKMAKRSKKVQRLKALEEANEDQEMLLTEEKGIDHDTKTYAKMLQGPKDSDDEDENSEADEDDGFNDEPLTPKEHAAKQKATTKPVEKDRNPLIYKLPEEPTSIKTARWFSNPLFESIGNAAQLAAMTVKKANVDAIDVMEEDDADEVMAMSSDDESNEATSKKRKKKATKGKASESPKSEHAIITADDVLAMMPRTDKQIRHERRLKSVERQDRKKAKKSRQAGEIDGDFEIAAAKADELDDDEDQKFEGLSEPEKKKVLEARALIKAGMGDTSSNDKANTGFEVVSAGASSKAGKRPLPIADTREYDSENEDYDSDDYAQTLALGTMMLRRSKAKALVDASYNRFAWNDPEGLPDWFQDDENRHYRPQLPIPPELLAKMKEKMVALSTKPIAKVAEARARKSRRAKTKLTAAKKKAESVANSSEMSETMKLKAISKAMRGQDAKKPGKTYVVSKKGRGAGGAKGVKFVDKREKSDKRSMERSLKKKKGGKKGGLTGSKQRRNHS